MLVDVWQNWWRKWQQPSKRVPVRRSRSAHSEALEDRLLLGEFTPSDLPEDATDYAAVESQELLLAAVDFNQQVMQEAALATLAVATFPADSSPGEPDIQTVSNEVSPDSPTTARPTTFSSSELGGHLVGRAIQGKSATASQLKQTARQEARQAKAEQRAAQRAAKKAPKAPSSSGSSGSPTSSTSTGASGVGGIDVSDPADSATGTASPNTSAAVPGLGVTLPATGSSGTITTTGTSHSVSAEHSETFASMMADPQLTATEVEQLLDRASAATPSRDAIIVVVDRQGIILGVRTEADVPTGDLAKLVFSIDGAVAEARTAAYFSNDQGTLTSRTVRFISQTTITQREVESNPSITDMNSTIAGPGFVAPIGLGGHFPPGVAHTPVVDLFGIEHTNRDSLDDYPGGEGRFNADYVSAAQEINAPKSYGVQSGLMPDALPRGIATLPGGIPLYRDTNGNNVGDTLIGGIGVFFPGPDGYATYEQGFVHGDGQSATARTNAPLVLEAEAIALAAIGSSRQAGIVATPIGGVPPVTGIDLPFPRIDLVGITLEAVGPTAGIEGVRQIQQLLTRLGPGTVNGTNQPVTPAATTQAGKAVPTGWLVAPHAGVGITAADVTRIIEQGIKEANRVRAAIRVPLGTRTKMVFAVTDSTGEVLGLYRMDDATYFSLDVAVAKARNISYYNNPAQLQPEDRVLAKQDPAVNPKGVAFTSRTFRFLTEARYPSGVDGTKPGPFSILNEASINPKNAENKEVNGVEVVAPAKDFMTVQGYDSFNIGTNFRDNSTSPDNQNGVVFFPGSSGVYKNGVIVGGLGVSGDGVDQDDVVTTATIKGYAPPTSIRADQYTYRKVRLPYNKFLRNPYG